MAWICLSTFALAVESSDKHCNSVKYSAPSGHANDIEFIFDKPYACGRFANGDWWVRVDNFGTVGIIDVLPMLSDGLNGLEINPKSKHKQGFDRRVSGYDPSLNPKLPVHIRGNASVVKAVSVSGKKNDCRPCLQFAAVLTIVTTGLTPGKNILRPAYFGNKKIFIELPDDVFSQIHKYPAVSYSEAKYSDFEKIAKRYQGVQIDHLENWVGGNIHPIDNMPYYGASIAVDNSVSVLRFLLNDFDIQRKAHWFALVNYLQSGVDLQFMALGGVTWPANGGHGNGRKLPILFAGRILGYDTLYEQLGKSYFSEDQQVYFSEKAGRALYGSPCSDDYYWMVQRLDRGPRDCRDPYGYIDGGGYEIGSGYQVCCTAMPWKYTALALRMLGWEKEWGNNAFLEYVDRWVNEGAWASPDPCAPYNNIPDDYMKVYGPGKVQECIYGNGRYKDKHGTSKDAGYYRSRLGDQMWRYFKKQELGR